MATPVYYKNIQRQLFLYANLVQQSNSIGLSDESIHAENFICNLLNTTFNWKLKNANPGNKNQDSFDLFDKSRKLYVQVTSNKSHATKYKRTIESFKRSKARRGFSRLIILFISPQCNASLLSIQKHKGFTSEAFDFSKLLTAIHHRALPISVIKNLHHSIQEYLRPVDITGNGENAAAEIIKQQAPRPKQKGIIIKREQLIDQLAKYVQDGNGLIVGGPGGGKTHSLEQLQLYCLNNKIPCFILRINELSSGSDDDINKFFGLRQNWLTSFKKIAFTQNNKQGILIFDAFDTAKDELLKASMLVAIKRSIAELKTNWNILVSSRSFEATKSTRLMELFPPANILNPVYCRFFEIPLLSSDEVETSLKKSRRIYPLYVKCTPELREIIRTPYFLKLFEKIIVDNKDLKVSEISHLETAEQLLSKFWNKHITNESQKDLFLRNLTRLLVTKENLSVRKDEIVTEGNLHTVDQLLSDEILIEGSPTRQKVLFGHNILLEYAISIYLIPEDENLIVAFIEDNQKLPFHFRQSFIYFYNQLWRNDNAIFWKHYQITRVINAPIFRLFHQTILNYLVVTSFSNSSDLEPIWSLSEGSEKGTVLRKVLEGIRFLKKEILTAKDVKFLADVSENMHEYFLWELGFLLNKAFDDQKKQRTPKLISNLTKAAFNYLEFVLVTRKHSPNKYLIENNGGNWAIRNLCHSFAYDKTSAAKFVKQILDILKEPEFPIRFFWILSDDILKIYEYDKPTGISIIRACYFHVENSDSETTLGTGVVMNLRSNRRQDFESIHYKLETDFPQLLQLSAHHSIPLAVEIANKLGVGSWRSTWRGKSFDVKVAGVKSKVTQDYNIEPFGDDDEKYGPGAPIARVFEKLSADIEDPLLKKSTHKNIKLVIKHAEQSAIWKRIIDHFTEFPEHYLSQAYSLLLNQIFLIIEETTYESGNLITALWPFLNKSQKVNLEKSILALKTSRLVREDDNFMDNRIRRFLNCIPAEDLEDATSNEIISGQCKKDNKPLRERPTLMPHNADKNEKMTRAGLNPENEDDNNFYDLVERLEKYNHLLDQDSKTKPDKKDYMPLLELAVGLFDHYVIPGIPNQNTKEYCDYHISSFLRHLTRLGNKLSKKIRFQIDRISIAYINDSFYFSPMYEVGEPNTRSTAFSPTARTNSVGTLATLLSGKKDPLLAKILKPLIADNTKIIRFKVMRMFTYFWHHERPEFWTLLRSRYKVENDGLVLSELLRNISFNNIIEDNIAETEFAAKEVLTQLKSIHGKIDNELWMFYSCLLVKLMYYFKSETAVSLFTENLSNKPLARALILHLFSLVDPHDKENDYKLITDLHKAEFEFFRKILAFQFQVIRERGINAEGINDNFEILDHFIQQFNFTILNGKKRNKGKPKSSSDQHAFFYAMKPLLSFFVDESNKIGTGFMVAHTGYYFMQVLNKTLGVDPEYVLSISAHVVRLSAESGFTYDNSTLAEIVKLTELIMADHKIILQNAKCFNDLLTILDLFANSGWQEAIELTWKLKEIF